MVQKLTLKETKPSVTPKHQESSAHWPAPRSPWETILGRLIGSGRVNNGMMGTANVRVKGQQRGLHIHIESGKELRAQQANHDTADKVMMEERKRRKRDRGEEGYKV
ncbi:Protein C4 [Dissostichus eleginoides]|uniref:Protein C4 n=1 Tax=Dissostichus eleginoides TaxID=100907 RepID=A0AAD9FK31_DISEL|nr:Protein C4 [Dissostichus eleginoides]